MEHGHAGGIYILKLEAAVRAVKEAASAASTSRFVPVTLPAARSSTPRLPCRRRHLPPQLGAPLGFRTFQACPKDLPRGRW